VRLGYSSLRKAWTSAGIVGGTVIVRSMDQAVRTHEAMMVRGYTGEIPFEKVPALARREWWTIGATGTVLLIVFSWAQTRLR
jgi:energy-coupling factor transporter transmembrane protein EcfT